MSEYKVLPSDRKSRVRISGHAALPLVREPGRSRKCRIPVDFTGLRR
jgi:hypothetical protein